jgi:hypothetical protein
MDARDDLDDNIQGVDVWGHGGEGGPHGEVVRAGEGDGSNVRSSINKASKEQKIENTSLRAQNLMMVQSNLVLFLATIIFDEKDSSYPIFNVMGKEDVFEMMFQNQGLCITEGEMAYLSMRTSELSSLRSGSYYQPASYHCASTV